MTKDSRSLGSMTVEEVLSHVGETVITKELGGTILIAVLKGVRVERGVITSIVVTEDGFNSVVWPTQWRQAVLA